MARGDFGGEFTRVPVGSLALGGIDQDDVQPKGDILIGGEPIDFEKTDTNGDGVGQAPPVVFYKNGTGTRNSVANTSQSQSTLL